MGYQHVLLEKTEGVAIITLNRPEVLNAMNFQLTMELNDAMTAANIDDEVGCIILTGSGHKAFSAGGDIHEQRTDARERTEEEREARSAQRAQWQYQLSASPKPTLGMMNGLAYGGGSVLASSLDMRVGCQHSTFRFLAAAYGRINSTWTLPNQVGWPIAKELLFTGRVVEAEEAHRIGLLNHLVPCDQLKAKAMEIATTIAKNRRESITGIKELLLQHLGENLHQQFLNEKDFTTHKVRGYGADQAFPEFISRRGRKLD
ncbi:MAG: enoyl-CoA hydratase/isomerase family protein [SAR202 cluster bacterium]|nr:enoyl-CoA hydratase/isomerase family protein [SAR202 cluster bacterium]